MARSLYQFQPVAQGQTSLNLALENALLHRNRRFELGAFGFGPGVAGGTVLPDPAWDAVYGGEERAQENAWANGMDYRSDMSGLGRFRDIGAFGVNPLEAQSARNIAISRASDIEAQRRREEDAANQVFLDRKQQVARDDMARSYDQSVYNAQVAPPVERSTITHEVTPGKPDKYTVRPAATDPRALYLDRLPGPERAKVEAQLATIAQKQAEIDETKRHNLATEASKAPVSTPVMVDATGAPLTGDAVLARLAPPERAQVQALASGKMPFPTGRAVTDNSYWKRMLDLVSQYDPTFDAVNYNARANTQKDFTSGASAKQINAISTVIGHLSDLANAGTQLDNGSLNWLNAVRNKLTPGGSDRGVAINNFETLKEGVATELMRVWRQAGVGSEKEIEDWKAQIGSTKSPQELRGAFATIAGMLESKLSALDSQYRQGMGTADVSIITPESQARLDRLSRGQGGQPPAAPGGSVKLMSPDGSETMDVPADRVEHYLRLGAKRVGG